jgi:hypothetical protein
MAGRGPAPAQQRRRLNDPARGEWTDLPPLDKPTLGTLRSLLKGSWSAATIATWETWRRDPVTAMWSPADVAYALDLARLYELMTPRSAAEVRLRMDGLGLTPKGKRDLRWRIVGAPGDEPDRAPRTRSGSARRSRLSVVK